MAGNEGGRAVEDDAALPPLAGCARHRDVHRRPFAASPDLG
jgi:hypothetical protein